MTYGKKNQYLVPFIVLTSLFFMWGFITVLVDSLIPRLKEIFELSYFQAGLVQFAFFMAYFLISIPAGALLSKIGYKRGMLVGLITMGVGCSLFYPAAGMRVFPLFMLGYFTLAAGMTILQVAANPFVAVLGDERGAASRLNLSQAFNSLGTTLAPLIGAAFILSDNIKTSDEIKLLSTEAKESYFSAEASAVQTPFLVLAGCLILLALIVLVSKLPQLLSNKDSGGYGHLLSKKKLMFGALGIFTYVGAEVAIGSYLVSYFIDMDMAEMIKSSPTISSIAETLLGKKELGAVDPKGIVGAFVALYWGGAMVGRFIGSGLNAMFKPSRILTFAGLGSITMILISMSTTGFASMWSILAVGLFNSVMFPTIFTEAIEGLGEDKPKGSGVLCTAIVGGAVIPPLFGLVTDNFGFKLAFILVLCCYAYIAWYASNSSKLSNA